MNTKILYRMIILCLALHSAIYANYRVAICAIFQEEAPYLKEWIEFHKLQGIEHFYLYNNLSTDNYLEVLAPYVESGEVTLIDWPFTYEEGDHPKWIAIQSGAYKDCIKNFGSETQWLAVIDIDEFLFCPEGQDLYTFLIDYKKYGGLCVNWIKFGTSNVEEIPADKCLIEMLTRCAPYNDFEHYRVKSIVQPKHVSNCTDPHYFIYKNNKKGVDVNKNPVTGQRSTYVNLDKIRINHYWTRATKYFMERKIESRQHRRPEYTKRRILDMADKCNLNFDTAILRFVEPLRENMGFTENGNK